MSLARWVFLLLRVNFDWYNQMRDTVVLSNQQAWGTENLERQPHLWRYFCGPISLNILGPITVRGVEEVMSSSL